MRPATANVTDRIAATAKGQALIKPDGGSHPLQPKRAEYDKNLAQLGTAGIGASCYRAALCEFRRLRGGGQRLACRQISDGLAEIEQNIKGGFGGQAAPFGRAALRNYSAPRAS